MPYGIIHPYFVRLPDYIFQAGMKGLPSSISFRQDKLQFPFSAKKMPCGIIHPYFVRMKGLEPPRLSAPDPKSGSATNYDTSAV
jgi:hypothetical protein